MFTGNCFNISFSKKFPFIIISKKDLFSIFIVAITIGFLGFLTETLLDYLLMEAFYDRGFLFGPFIPVYFFVAFIGLLILKTPKAKFSHFLLYVLIIGGGISLVEFVVGNLCEKLFDAVLWTYDGNMNKYASVKMGLSWGLLGAILMMFFFPLYKLLIDRIPSKFYWPIIISFVTIFLTDIIGSIVYVANNDWKYEILYEYNASKFLSLSIYYFLFFYVLLTILFTKYIKIFKQYKKAIIITFISFALFVALSIEILIYNIKNEFIKLIPSLGIFVTFFIYILCITSFLSYLYLLIYSSIKKIEDEKKEKLKKKSYKISFITSIVLLFILDLVIFKNIDWFDSKTLFIYQGAENVFFLFCVLGYAFIVRWISKSLYKKLSSHKKLFVSIFLVSVYIPLFTVLGFKFNLNFFPFNILVRFGYTIIYCYAFIILSLLFIFLIRFILIKTIKRGFVLTNLFTKLCFLIAVLSLVIYTTYGFVSFNSFDVKHLVIGTGNNNLKIVFVSDVHYATSGVDINLKKMCERINEQSPDVVLFAGDIVDGRINDKKKEYFINSLKSIKSKYGKYAVLGNHDLKLNSYVELRNIYKEANVILDYDATYLIDNKVQLFLRLDYSYLARKKMEDVQVDFYKYPTIVLDHQPFDYLNAKESGAKLQLSGHTHNGQLFPFNFVVNMFSLFMYDSSYIDGLKQMDDFSIYTSKGYGSWGMPLRTTGNPEIVNIDFKY